MAQPSEGTEVTTEREQRMAEFRLRAAQPSRGQQHLVVSAVVAERVAAWRRGLGQIVRVSDDGVTFSAAIGVLMDVLELMGADYSKVLTRAELIELAKAYPYRGRKAAERPSVLPQSTSRDPLSPMPLVRDRHGAVFSLGHRWKMARHENTDPEADGAWQDICTKCGEQRYQFGLPTSKKCPYALEQDDYQGQRAKEQQLFMVWKQEDLNEEDNPATPEAP